MVFVGLDREKKGTDLGDARGDARSLSDMDEPVVESQKRPTLRSSMPSSSVILTRSNWSVGAETSRTGCVLANICALVSRTGRGATRRGLSFWVKFIFGREKYMFLEVDYWSKAGKKTKESVSADSK